MPALLLTALLAALIQAGQPRGPVEQVPGWTSNGPDGGRVATLATSADGAALYAGTAGGLFKSTDGGGSWGRLDSFPRFGFSSIFFVGVAPSNPSVVYAVDRTPTIHFNTFRLLRSEDGGATWAPTALSIQDDGPTSFSVAIDPTDALTVYASIDCCTSKSMDGGQTFAPLGSVDIASVAIDPTNPSTLYGNAFLEDQPGHSSNHLQKSVDAGATWTPTGLVTDVEFSIVDPDDPRILYAFGSRFARSDDAGISISSETTLPGSLFPLALGGGSPRRLYAAVFSGSSSSLYASADRGATWSLAGAPPGGLLSFVVTSAPESPDRVFAASLHAEGVFLSIDGGTDWEARSTGLRASDIGALAVLPSDGRFAYALGPGFAKTSDGGLSWSVDAFAPVAGSGGLAVDPTSPDVIYAADTTAGVRRSSDAGATWSDPSPTGKFVNWIAIDPVHPTIVYAADGRPLKSIDGGGTWQVVNAGIPDGVTQVRVDSANDDILYAISTQLYRSANAGKNWTLALDSGVISVVPDPGHPGTVYASAGYVLRSLDYGSTWERMSFDPDVVIDELACDGIGVVYAAGRSANPYFLGLTTPLRSDDGGATWSSIGGWDPNALSFPFLVRALAVDLSARNLYAGTERGVWRAPILRTRQVSRP